jgi:hypothetical protein
LLPARTSGRRVHGWRCHPRDFAVTCSASAMWVMGYLYAISAALQQAACLVCVSVSGCLGAPRNSRWSDYRFREESAQRRGPQRVARYRGISPSPAQLRPPDRPPAPVPVNVASATSADHCRRPTMIHLGVAAREVYSWWISSSLNSSVGGPPVEILTACPPTSCPSGVSKNACSSAIVGAHTSAIR